jgi:hypothetical protein
MTLEDAVEAFEKDFAVVSNAIGFAGDQEIPGRVDPERAGDGSRYVVLTSGGVKRDLQPVGAWFVSEADATDAWLLAARDYALQRGGKRLFWRDQPRWVSAEFLAMDQLKMMESLEMKQSIQLNVGFVWSRLAVSAGSQSTNTGI